MTLIYKSKHGFIASHLEVQFYSGMLCVLFRYAGFGFTLATLFWIYSIHLHIFVVSTTYS